MEKTRRSIALVAAAGMLFSSCQSIYKKATRAEEDTGRTVHRQILSNFYLYTEPKLNGYVSRIGRAVAHQSRRSMDYEYFILVSDKLYASSVPGGKVYITTGFIAFLENEAELAGVLAHEIGELQYMDPDYSGVKKLTGYAQGLSTLAVPVLGPFGILAFIGASGLHATASAEKGLPERVTTADQLALRYLTEAGYDPQGLLDVMYRILDVKDREICQVSDYFNHRPITLDRMKKLKEAFRRLPLENRSFRTNREGFLLRSRGIREIYHSLSEAEKAPVPA